MPRSVGQGHSALGEGHNAILLLLGKKDPSDSAFLSSSNNTTMKSVLKVFSIKKGLVLFLIIQKLINFARKSHVGFAVSRHKMGCIPKVDGLQVFVLDLGSKVIVDEKNVPLMCLKILTFLTLFNSK